MITHRERCCAWVLLIETRRVPGTTEGHGPIKRTDAKSCPHVSEFVSCLERESRKNIPKHVKSHLTAPFPSGGGAQRSLEAYAAPAPLGAAAPRSSSSDVCPASAVAMPFISNDERDLSVDKRSLKLPTTWEVRIGAHGDGSDKGARLGQRHRAVLTSHTVTPLADCAMSGSRGGVHRTQSVNDASWSRDGRAGYGSRRTLLHPTERLCMKPFSPFPRTIVSAARSSPCCIRARICSCACAPMAAASAAA